MSKQKKRAERLTPVPVPRKTRPTPSSRPGKGGAPQEQAPSLEHIAEGLRSLAVPCSEVSFDPNNARLHGEESIDALKGSLRVYGQRRPIVVNKRTGHVEAGNGLLAAALSLGYTHIAALFVDEDPAKAAGYSLADNQTALLSSWDDKALGELIRDLNTGNDAALDRMVSDLAEKEKLIPSGEPENTPETSPEHPPLSEWMVNIQCDSQEHQTELLKRLTAEGLKAEPCVPGITTVSRRKRKKKGGSTPQAAADTVSEEV